MTPRARGGLLRVPAAALWAAGCLAGAPADAGARGFDCLIEPFQTVEIRSPVEGLIAKVHVERGATIRKGQVLVELDSEVERSAAEAARFRSDMTGRIEASRNRVEHATRKFERAQELHRQNFLSAQARDEAQVEKRLAESELKDALETQDLAKLEHRRALDQLRLRSLRSPFDGYVVDRMLHPGDLAESGTGRKGILKIAQLDPLRVEVVLPQDAYGRIKAGSRAAILPEGFPGTYTAQVTVVDRVIDAASGMFGVRLELANPKGVLPGGIRCAVEFPGVKPPAAEARNHRPEGKAVRAP